MTRLKKLKIFLLPIGIGLIVLANTFYLRSSMLGTISIIAYMVLTSFLLGNVFLENEEEGFVRFTLGFFIAFSFIVVVSAPLLIFFKLDFRGLAIILFSPLILPIILTLLRNPKEDTKQEETQERKKAPLFSLTYIVYLILVGYSLYLLIQARSGWVYGTVWSVVSPNFFTTYFLAGVVLVTIILYSSTRATSKLVLIIPYALIAAMIPAIVLYPGVSGDPFDHMGFARVVVEYGNFRVYPFAAKLNPWSLYWLVKEKALPLSTAIFTEILCIDVYWVHSFITPLLWGIFIPIATYKISKLLEIGERTALIASFFAGVYMNFLGWGSRSTGNSFGFIPFLVSFSFSLWYLKSNKNRLLLFLALLTAAASLIAHPMTGIVALIFFFLAINLKTYWTLRPQKPRVAQLFLGVTIFICLFAIPAFFLLNSVVYSVFAPQYASEATTRFSLDKLLKTDLWSFIFGEYATYTFKDIIISVLFPALGIVGLAYALKHKTQTQDKKLSMLFVGLAIILLIAIYRILNYAMIDVLFSPRRVWTFQDMLAIPLAVLTMSIAIDYLEGGQKPNPVKLLKFEKWRIKISWRLVFTAILVGLTFSAFALVSVSESYGRYGGMQLTELEVEAVKYIDQHTTERYVVATMPATTQVGWGFAGMWNPSKYYIYDNNLGEKPTVKSMFDYMKQYQAGVGYYIALSFRTPSFNKAIADASRIFGLFKILTNEKGSIYIFKYMIPPIPTGPDVDVMAYHWDTPAAYFVQNGLVRIIFNPSTLTLDVTDFFGDLYERLNLNQTLVDGAYVGNFQSIERFDPTQQTWLEWNPDDQISPSTEFRFRINFQNESLIGALQRSVQNIQLAFENAQTATLSVETGDFTRLYIPGLIGGPNSYDVNSRDYGMFYTLSRTPEVVLRPAYKSETSTSVLTFSDIVQHCKLNITDTYLTYEFYVENTAQSDQWASIEIWLPDVIYKGIFMPLRYSLDGGKTWSESVAYGDFPRGIPIKTMRENEVNWAFTQVSKASEAPNIWRTFTKSSGGSPSLPPTFTDSGGAQNRILLSVYLPSGDEALLQVGFATYYSRPLKVTYVFTDSDDIAYGLRNMREGTIKFYGYGTSAYVGGITTTIIPSSLSVTEEETGKIKSILLTISGDTSFSLLSAKGVDTTIDANGDGIPDRI